jgi:hypothetical protein
MLSAYTEAYNIRFSVYLFSETVVAEFWRFSSIEYDILFQLGTPAN